MIDYFNGLAWASHSIPWALGALSPVLVTALAFWGLRKPYSASQRLVRGQRRKMHARLTARRLRREAAYGVRSGG